MDYRLVDPIDPRACGIWPDGTLWCPPFHWLHLRRHIHDHFVHLWLFIGGVN